MVSMTSKDKHLSVSQSAQDLLQCCLPLVKFVISYINWNITETSALFYLRKIKTAFKYLATNREKVNPNIYQRTLLIFAAIIYKVSKINPVKRPVTLLENLTFKLINNDRSRFITQLKRSIKLAQRKVKREQKHKKSKSKIENKASDLITNMSRETKHQFDNTANKLRILPLKPGDGGDVGKEKHDYSSLKAKFVEEIQTLHKVGFSCGGALRMLASKKTGENTRKVSLKEAVDRVPKDFSKHINIPKPKSITHSNILTPKPQIPENKKNVSHIKNKVKSSKNTNSFLPYKVVHSKVGSSHFNKNMQNNKRKLNTSSVPCESFTSPLSNLYELPNKNKYSISNFKIPKIKEKWKTGKSTVSDDNWHDSPDSKNPDMDCEVIKTSEEKLAHKITEEVIDVLNSNNFSLNKGTLLSKIKSVLKETSDLSTMEKLKLDSSNKGGQSNFGSTVINVSKNMIANACSPPSTSESLSTVESVSIRNQDDNMIKSESRCHLDISNNQPNLNNQSESESGELIEVEKKELLEDSEDSNKAKLVQLSTLSAPVDHFTPMLSPDDLSKQITSTENPTLPVKKISDKNTVKKRVAHKCELDRLHDDIKNMYIGKEVVKAFGARKCKKTTNLVTINPKPKLNDTKTTITRAESMARKGKKKKSKRSAWSHGVIKKKGRSKYLIKENSEKVINDTTNCSNVFAKVSGNTDHSNQVNITGCKKTDISGQQIGHFEPPQANMISVRCTRSKSKLTLHDDKQQLASNISVSVAKKGSNSSSTNIKKSVGEPKKSAITNPKVHMLKDLRIKIVNNIDMDAILNKQIYKSTLEIQGETVTEKVSFVETNIDKSNCDTAKQVGDNGTLSFTIEEGISSIVAKDVASVGINRIETKQWPDIHSNNAIGKIEMPDNADANITPTKILPLSRGEIKTEEVIDVSEEIEIKTEEDCGKCELPCLTTNLVDSNYIIKTDATNKDEIKDSVLSYGIFDENVSSFGIATSNCSKVWKMNDISYNVSTIKEESNTALNIIKRALDVHISSFGCVYRNVDCFDLSTIVVNMNEIQSQKEQNITFCNECSQKNQEIQIRIGPLEISFLNGELFYVCSVTDCKFFTKEDKLITDHVEVFHGYLNWNWSCSICDVIPLPNVDRVFFNLSLAVHHMVEWHNIKQIKLSEDKKLGVHRVGRGLISCSKSKCCFDKNTNDVFLNMNIHNNKQLESVKSIGNDNASNESTQTASGKEDIEEEMANKSEMIKAEKEPSCITSPPISGSGCLIKTLPLSTELNIKKICKIEKVMTLNPACNQGVECLQQIGVQNGGRYLITGGIFSLPLPVVQEYKNISNLVEDKRLINLFKCVGKQCAYTTNSCKCAINHYITHEKQMKNGCSDKNWRICVYCGIEAVSAKSYTLHILLEHGQSIYQCPYCFYRSVSKTNTELHQHLEHKVNTIGMLKCAQPSLKFPRQKRCTQKKFLLAYLCGVNECLKTFYVPQDLTSHLKKHQEHLFYSCGLCNYVGIGAADIIKHYKNHEMATYQCFYCLCGSSQIGYLRTHLCTVHPSKPPKCIKRAAYSEELAKNKPGDFRISPYIIEKEKLTKIILEDKFCVWTKAHYTIPVTSVSDEFEIDCVRDDIVKTIPKGKRILNVNGNNGMRRRDSLKHRRTSKKSKKNKINVMSPSSSQCDAFISSQETSTQSLKPLHLSGKIEIGNSSVRNMISHQKVIKQSAVPESTILRRTLTARKKSQNNQRPVSCKSKKRQNNFNTPIIIDDSDSDVICISDTDDRPPIEERTVLAKKVQQKSRSTHLQCNVVEVLVISDDDDDAKPQCSNLNEYSHDIGYVICSEDEAEEPVRKKGCLDCLSYDVIDSNEDDTILTPISSKNIYIDRCQTLDDIIFRNHFKRKTN